MMRRLAFLAIALTTAALAQAQAAKFVTLPASTSRYEIAGTDRSGSMFFVQDYPSAGPATRYLATFSTLLNRWVLTSNSVPATHSRARVKKISGNGQSVLYDSLGGSLIWHRPSNTFTDSVIQLSSISENGLISMGVRTNKLYRMDLSDNTFFAVATMLTPKGQPMLPNWSYMAMNAAATKVAIGSEYGDFETGVETTHLWTGQSNIPAWVEPFAKHLYPVDMSDSGSVTIGQSKIRFGTADVEELPDTSFVSGIRYQLPYAYHLSGDGAIAVGNDIVDSGDDGLVYEWLIWNTVGGRMRELRSYLAGLFGASVMNQVGKIEDVLLSKDRSTMILLFRTPTTAEQKAVVLKMSLFPAP